MTWVLAAMLGCSTDDWCARFNLTCDQPVDIDRRVIDQDNDVWPADQDCDDTRSDVYPGAAEICDGVDNNCDGQTDEVVGSTAYIDADQDGYGDPGGVTRTYCDEPPLGFVSNSSDCDDGSGASFPGAQELCDDADNDCDGEVDEDSTGLYYPDADGDGFGDDAGSAEFCITQEPSGYIARGGDCDDTTGAVAPGQREQCLDEVDNNCDGSVDESGCAYPGGFLYSEASYVQSGVSFATGDLNGDGHPDIAIGTPSAQTGTSTYGGDVDLIYGPISGDVLLDTHPDRIYGLSDLDDVGAAVAVPGDVNQDGYDDVLVGAPYTTVGTNPYSGGAYLFFGPVTGEYDFQSADVSFPGEHAYVYQGFYLDEVGDLTGDGAPELAIWDVSSKTAGALALYDAAAGGSSQERGEALGRVLTDTEVLGTTGDARGADFDGDGVGDLLLGDGLSSSYSGEVYLFSGPVTGDLRPEDAAARIRGITQNEQFGQQLATPVDLDGDGYLDVASGTSSTRDGPNTVGGVYVFLGPLPEAQRMVDANVTFLGAVGDDIIGFQAASGDFDRDGLPELVFSGARYSTYEAVLFSAPLPDDGYYRSDDSAVTPFVVDNLSSTRTSLSDGADIDGDGFDDLLLGVPDLSQFSFYGGAVRYFSAP